jgi:hypothetical protein
VLPFPFILINDLKGLPEVINLKTGLQYVVGWRIEGDHGVLLVAITTICNILFFSFFFTFSTFSNLSSGF